MQVIENKRKQRDDHSSTHGALMPSNVLVKCLSSAGTLCRSADGTIWLNQILVTWSCTPAANEKAPPSPSAADWAYLELQASKHKLWSFTASKWCMMKWLKTSLGGTKPSGECDVLNYLALQALKGVLSTFTEKLQGSGICCYSDCI